MCIECEVARAELSRKRDNTPPEPPTKKNRVRAWSLVVPVFCKQKEAKGLVKEVKKLFWVWNANRLEAITIRLEALAIRSGCFTP